MSFEIINIPDGDLTFSRTWRESESVDWMERLRKEIEWEQHRIKIFDNGLIVPDYQLGMVIQGLCTVIQV